MSVTAGTEAKRELREVRLEEGFKNGANHLLSHPVSDSGDAQRTKFAFSFRDEDPAQGNGAVASAFEVEHQGGEIVVQVGLESADTDLVHARRAAIALDRKKSAAHTIQVDASREGMEFRQLVGQKTFLTAWRCCEAHRAEPARHSRTTRRLFQIFGLPEQARRTREGVTLGGNLP